MEANYKKRVFGQLFNLIVNIKLFNISSATTCVSILFNIIQLNLKQKSDRNRNGYL